MAELIKQSTRRLIDTLCSFDTTSRLSNLDFIHFVEDYLSGHGIRSTLIHDATGQKANLFATVGPEIDGGVVLSGHTDVVPIDGQTWSSDPFQVIERDGKLVGRGVADMKGFIAAALAMAPAFKAANLKVPVHYALSYDEEVGCLGVHSLIREIVGTTRPMAAIVGEPTSMNVVSAHKSCSRFSTHLVGLEVHSSSPHLGVNSIFHAAEIVSFIDSLAAEYRGKELDQRYSPPYSTVNVGTIQGGTASNIIPKETRISWEVRALKNEHRDDIVARVEEFSSKTVLARMRKRYPDASINLTAHTLGVGLVPEDSNPAETLALQLAGANQTYAVSYGTEAGLFQNAGIPTVICGPGNIEQAHKPDEWVALSQIRDCESFLERMLQSLGTP